MKKILFAMMGILLVSILISMSACSKNTAPNNTIPAGDASKSAETYKDCNEYCAKQPHTACEGDWTISGTLPDCKCTYECTATQEETAPTEEEIAADTKRIWSTDKQFYAMIGEGNEITAGFATYFPGDDDKVADRVTVGGPGIKDVKTGEVWIKIGTKPAKLKSIMHEFTIDDKKVFDSPLKSGDRGILTFKLYDDAGKVIENDLSIGIVPKVG